MESRTTNSIKNIIFSLAFQLVTLILSFVNRTVFIWILGVNYLGISGLFSDILVIKKSISSSFFIDKCVLLLSLSQKALK